MSPAFEFYDASASADAAEKTTTSDVLRDLNRAGTSTSLRRALGELNDLVDETTAKDRAEGVPPELAGLLTQITGEEDAPLSWASLHRRVGDGLTTWDSFWLDPTQEEDGMRLVSEVMRRSAEELQLGLAAAHETRSDPAR